MHSLAGTTPSPPSAPKTGRKKGAVAPNNGKRHNGKLRQQCWDAWELKTAALRRAELGSGRAALHSSAGLRVLQQIAAFFQVPGGKLSTQVQWLRRWFERKIADPDFDLLPNASGAGGASKKHPFPPVTERSTSGR